MNKINFQKLFQQYRSQFNSVMDDDDKMLRDK